METDYTLMSTDSQVLQANGTNTNAGNNTSTFLEAKETLPQTSSEKIGEQSENALPREESNEEDDILGLLSERPNSSQRTKGILKRSNIIESSNSYQYEPPPDNIRRQSSKVQFVRTAPFEPSIIELHDFDQSKSVEVHLDDDHEPGRVGASRKRQSAGSRFRTSITNLAKRSKRKISSPQRPKLERLQSQLDLDDLSRNELELKASLYFHIGNPIKRWKVDQVVPIKLLLQLLKTVVLTVQVVLFTFTISHERSDFFFEGREVFESLFIKNFQNGITEPRDTYFSYTTQDMFKQFNYTAERYYSLPDISLGGFGYNELDENGDPVPLTMELTRYRVADFDTISNSYTLDGEIDTISFNVSKGDNAEEVYLRESEDKLFHRFISLKISIPIKNIRIVDPERAECHLFNVMIIFENVENIGKISYFLKEEHHRVACNEEIETEDEKLIIIMAFLTVLDGMLLVMSCISIALTLSSIRRGVKLSRAMGKFYRRELDIKLSWKERRSLFPLWHVVNTISDLLILSGTILKILLDYGSFSDANHASRLLGTAILFQAVVIMRYITYFKQLNALTRTISLAVPELMRFLFYVIILFLAFALTGWLILGPFHEKFEDLNGTVETLFSMVNGDDIYNTFILIDWEDDPLTYIYSRFYLYIFSILFLYFVLNMFTSLVLSAYDKSKTFDTAYENEVRRFVFSGALTPGGAALRDVTSTKNYVDPEVIRRRLKSPQDLEKSKPDPFRFRGNSQFESTESDPEF